MSLQISVVIPVHDQAPRLRLTLAALQRQTGVDLRDCEVIVVDDESRDGVRELVSRMGTHPLRALSLIGCQSRGSRGMPRNLGAQAARGELLVFLDADACPGEELLSRHLAAHQAEPGVVLGDIFVVPDTEALLDPSVGVPFPAFALSAASVATPPLRVSEQSWSEGIDAFFLRHARKGSYPGLERWHRQLEDLLAARSARLSWMGAIPHNLSIPRSDLLRLGGFDPFLAHAEGWDLGIRARRAGLPIRCAPGARSFHLFHWRPPLRDFLNQQAARRALCERYPEELPAAGYVWFAAMSGDPYVPAELNLNSWRVVEALMADGPGRQLIRDQFGSLARRSTGLTLMDYLAGRAVNSPMDTAGVPSVPVRDRS